LWPGSNHGKLMLQRPSSRSSGWPPERRG
ncbi:hypothetical protein BAE44_0009660, partial [Dichanthelium oligosanthes]